MDKRAYYIYYLAERGGECDFIVCRGNNAEMAVQVSYDINNQKTLKREIAGLLLAAKKTGCNRLLLLTDHTYADIKENGYTVTVQPVYDWTLAD